MPGGSPLFPQGEVRRTDPAGRAAHMFQGRQRWMTTSPLTGTEGDDPTLSINTGLDLTQQRHLDVFHHAQTAMHQYRAEAQAARQQQLAAATPVPNPPADQQHEPAVEFDGDDRTCPICLSDFQHGERVVRLRCRHVLHRGCNDDLMQHDDGTIVRCPVCRGRGDAIAYYRFIAEGRPMEPPPEQMPHAPTQAGSAQDYVVGTPRRAAAADTVGGAAPSTPPAEHRMPQTPPSAASYATAASQVPVPDGWETWHDLHMPPHLPWWPTAAGDTVSGAAHGTDGQYFLASTDLPDGRLGVIVDSGAWTNLWGSHFARRLAQRALNNGHWPAEERLSTPLYVAGVGNGSQQANFEIQIPIATTSRDGTTTMHNMSAPSVEGESGSRLPALLGLRSMQAQNGVLETNAERPRLTFPGKGGYSIEWAPGATHFDLVAAPSGHLLIPVDDYEKVPPPTGGLPPKQLTLLTHKGSQQTDDDAHDDGRRFGKLMVVLLHASAKLPKKATESAAGYDVFAYTTLTVQAKSRAMVPTGVAALAPPGTYIRIAPRSGLAFKSIDVAAGVVDPDYRGEIKVILVNNSDDTMKITPGLRIAQLILERIITNADVVQVESLPATTRGSQGFGSTGMAYLNMGPVRVGLQDAAEGAGTTGAGPSGSSH